MRRSTILFSCARFIMLSLSGARQIAGNKVRMSIFIVVAAVYDRRINYAMLAERRYRRNLLADLERSPLTVTRSGAVQHRADRVNGLPVATNDSAHVALAKLHFEDGHLASGNFGQHHVIRKFNQLANDELEKLFHLCESVR